MSALSRRKRSGTTRANCRSTPVLTQHIIKKYIGGIVYKSDMINGIDQINCSEYKEGIYFLTLSNNEEIVTKKFIINRN